MYKILYHWSESCFSFSFLSYWQAERTRNPTPQPLHSTCRCNFQGQVMPPCHLPCRWSSGAPAQGKRLPRVQSRGSRARQQIQPSAPVGRVQVAQDPSEARAGTAAVHPTEQHSTEAAVHCFRCLDIPWAHRKMLGFIWSQIKYTWHTGGWVHKDVVTPSPPLFFSRENTDILYRI